MGGNDHRRDDLTLYIPINHPIYSNNEMFTRLHKFDSYCFKVTGNICAKHKVNSFTKTIKCEPPKFKFKIMAVCSPF